MILEMERALRKTLDIRRGEAHRVLMMFCYIFSIITTLMIIKPVVNAYFLSAFGVDKLPYVFIMVAFLGSLAVTRYTKWIQQVDMFRIMNQTMKLCIFSLILFWAFLYLISTKNEILFVLYVWTAIFGLITVSQFWILANSIFNPREAKRLFSTVGAGAIAGGIFGGYLTKFLATIIGSANLLLICAGFLSVCILIIKNLERISSENKRLQRARHQEQIVKGNRSAFAAVTSSRLLILLASIVGLSVMAAKLVEYQFSAIATAQINDPDKLTAFFGFWFSNLNVISLLIQLFVVHRVVSMMGAGKALLFLPAVILSGSLIIITFPALWAAVFLKVGDGSMKNSINKAAIEMMVLPVPAQIKKQAKAFIDVIVDSAATGLGGLLLLGMTAFFGYSVRLVAVAAVLLTAVWMYLVLQIRQEYLHAFRETITSAPGTEIVAVESVMPGKSMLDNLVAVLESNDQEQVVVKALQIARSLKQERLTPYYKRLVHHPSPSVRLEVLRNLYLTKDRSFIEDVQALLFDLDQDIKTEAMHYLFQHWQPDRVEMLRSYLDHNDYTISGAALLCAARESRRNRKYKELFLLYTVTENLLQSIPAIEDPIRVLFTKINCARVIGAANIPQLYPYLYIFINDSAEDVVEAAILAAGDSRHEDFITAIVEKLQNPALQSVCSNALKLFGNEAINILADYLNTPMIDRKIRRRIPLALALTSSQSAVDVLIDNLDQTDPAIRFAVIRALNQIKEGNSDLTFNQKRISRCILAEAKSYLNMISALYCQIHWQGSQTAYEQSDRHDEIQTKRRDLAKEIEKRLDENLERIFRLLGLRYVADDILKAYKGIKSDQADVRINAVEFLDNVLETDIKKTIIPIVETAMTGTMIDHTVERLGLKICNETEAFEVMLPEAEPALQLRVLELIDCLNDRRYAALVGELMGSTETAVRRSAASLLKKFGYLSDSPLD
jgi:AAA family ATP:ADP antiporter